MESFVQGTRMIRLTALVAFAACGSPPPPPAGPAAPVQQRSLPYERREEPDPPGVVTGGPRVIAGRWALTTSEPLPFTRDAIERGFDAAHDDIAACLSKKLIPSITATVRLTWTDGKLAATVVTENRRLGACAAAALVKVSWLAPRAATLDVIVTMRQPGEHD